MNNPKSQLVHISQLYYQQNLNQSEIAKILGISRPTVSRMLDEARKTGIVEIIVHDPIRKNPELSLKIRNRFNLKETIVISGKYKYDIALEKCAQEAAQFISTILTNNMSIGFSWGHAVRAVCNAFISKEYYNVSVVQMAGCLSAGDPTYDGLELAINVANKFNGTYSNIVSPVYVDHPSIQQALFNVPQIKNAIAKASSLDIAVTGVGTIDDQNGSIYITDSTPEELELAKRNGAVGHILARLIDSNGNEVSFPNHFPISAPLENMKAATWSVGVVASKSKAAATLAAIKGGYLNCLIIDESLALELIKISES